MTSSLLPAEGGLLPAVPVADVRDGGPVAHVRNRLAQAEAVRDSCLGWLPAGRQLARVGDPLVRWWLQRSSSAYVGDVRAVAATLRGPGVWLLHGAYLFGCTTLADESAEGPRLRRTLDWPFPGLGRLVEVVLQAGDAGDYLNVTWPGFTGVLTAVAPGRFAAAINQAPMRRRTRADGLRWLDYARNPAGAMLRRGREPPEHLLRRAFESCTTFASALRLLRMAPVARPVIFTLSGARPGERAVIEREETTARVITDETVTANAWSQPLSGWEPRVCGTGKPVENNVRRRAALAACTGRDDAPFAWAQPPVTNAFTRLTVEMSAATGLLRVAGWEADVDGRPRRATQVLTLNDAASSAALQPAAHAVA